MLVLDKELYWVDRQRGGRRGGTEELHLRDMGRLGREGKGKGYFADLYSISFGLSIFQILDFLFTLYVMHDL